MSRLALGAVLGLASSCGLGGLDDGRTSEDATASDEAELAADDVGFGSVCTRGEYRCHARIRTVAGFRAHAAAPSGYGPPDLQAAYKISPTQTAVERPTVAIVDAYGYAALESDLAVYRSHYGLPPCTVANGCLKIVNQLGQTSPLPPNPPPEDDWTVETALDIDMVSAACPLCKILVLQAQDSSGEGLFTAQRSAVALGATVISNSWGAPEQRGTSPAQIALTEGYLNHPEVATFVSAGDDGYNDAGLGPDYPATSAHVIAVGGTRLVRDASARGWSETAWAKGGSACSYAIPKPAYQTKSPCAFRATADIAAVGDPQTGLAVYNAANSGWITVGGTSASSPFVAAIFAATGNGGQSSGAFISASASKLFDVTTGNNGTCGADTLLCNAAVGWDGPTGYGTPNVSLMLPPIGGKVDDDTSGGCSTGPTGAGGLLGLALLRRRRRR